MSTLRVNSISGYDGESAVTFTKGLSVADGKSIDTNSIIVTGVVTATSYSGDGSGLSNISGITNSKGIALTFVI